MAMTKPWTDEEVEVFTQMFHDGASYEAMCTALNRTHAALKNKKKHLGLVRNTPVPTEAEAIPRSWTKRDDRRLIELARDGVSVADISKELRRSKSSIRGRAMRLEVTIGVAMGGVIPSFREPSKPRDIASRFLEGLQA